MLLSSITWHLFDNHAWGNIYEFAIIQPVKEALAPLIHDFRTGSNDRQHLHYTLIKTQLTVQKLQ